MEVDVCKKCGSPKAIRKNSRGGFFAQCTTPEKHLDSPKLWVIEKQPEAIPTTPAPVPTKGGLFDFFFGK